MAFVYIVLVLTALTGNVVVEAAETPASQAHFMVQVKAAISGSTSLRLCGGALLSTTHVVTAAACVLDDASTVKVYSGTATLWATGENGTEHSVSALRKHPSFSSTNGALGISYYFDVAVLRLATPVTLNGLASSISVAGSRPAVGSTLSLAGWGVYFFGNPPEPTETSRLEVDSVTVMASDQCSTKVLTPIPAGLICLAKTPDMGQSGSAAFAGGLLYALMSWGGSVATDLTNAEVSSFIATTVKSL
ncbi:trypsin delta-like [Thrips palmi]|uniref:Trypsin delta-like n=1 Tax=Thrips palmi TaxID=161013 RepID=A0A6P8Z8N7_THRPL|nr:trypsin delta-like [Thrips palmi]